MKIEKSFDIDRDRDLVWTAFGDVRFVASCLPGASIAEELGPDRHKGLFAIKLGPMAATFAGEVSIMRDPSTWTAVVSGKGSDAKSSSRASGSMTYRLSGGEGGTMTHVDVMSEINLAGALAQFGKAGVIQEVAGRLTAEFVRNFEARLAPAAADQQPTHPNAAEAPSAQLAAGTAAPAAALDAGSLLWAVLRDRISGVLRRMFGRMP